MHDPFADCTRRLWWGVGCALLMLLLALAPSLLPAQTPVCGRIGSAVTVQARDTAYQCLLKSGAVTYRVTILPAKAATPTPPRIDSTPATPVPPVTDPAPPTGDVRPVLSLAWGSYASLAALRADCTVFDCSNDHFGNSDVTLDATTRGPDGGPTLRYHYRHSGTGCNSITLGRDVRLPHALTEAWAEFHVKWSTNFTTGGQSPAHSCDPNDHKLIFGLVQSPSGEAGRWAFYVGSDSDPYHNLNQERPYPLWGGAYLNQSAPRAESLWASGTWHTIRLHLKNSTTGTSNDGVWEIWLDGKLIHRQTGFSVHDNGSNAPLTIRGFALGRNKDDGPPNVDEYLWWGPVTVYAANPGW